MECIVLRVDMSVSQAWRKTTPAIRAHYEKKIAEMLSELSKTELDPVLDNIGQITPADRLEEEKKE